MSESVAAEFVAGPCQSSEILNQELRYAIYRPATSRTCEVEGAANAPGFQYLRSSHSCRMWEVVEAERNDRLPHALAQSFAIHDLARADDGASGEPAKQ